MKDPDRKPVRLAEMTQYLIDWHYHFYGVFTKNYNELFRFWKEHVSVVYREMKEKLMLSSKQPMQPGVTFAEPPQDGKAMFKSRSKKTEEMERFGKCYEMDVAYTL